MTPIYTNSSSSPFPFELNNEDYDQNHSLLSLNYYQPASSSSHSSCQSFFNSTTQDQTKSYHTELYQPHHQSEVDHYGSRSGSYDLEKKNMARSGLKLTLWKKEDKYVNENEKNSVMWMSSKMRLMKKMKSSDREDMEVSTNCSSYNSSNNMSNNIPTRVCSDCNTTKTPLWRSGPKGPKSLCNACGIRQRKARRAMAAATAAAAAGTTANGTTLANETSSKLKIKVHPKEKITKVDTNNVKPYKKRCKFVTATTGSSSSNNSQKFEDFFINLSKNLALQRVFPQDEKEAAILLMAISSGLVHG